MINLDNKEKYTKRVGNLNNECSVLTASTLDDINQVFYAEGTTDPISTPINLSVRYVEGDDYHNLIVGASTDNFEPKTLYVISSDEINAYNTQIKNVGDPIKATDGANKRYVDEQIRDLEIPGEVSLENYYEKTETSSNSQLNTEFGKYYPKTETSSYSELSNEFESLNDKFVDVETNQEINGYKTFIDGIDIGDYIFDRGHNCLGVGNQLTVGLYNFYWKGIDINTSKKHATVYLSKTQYAYPMPFIVFDGSKTIFRLRSNLTVDINQTSTYKRLSGSTDLANVWNCSLDATRTDPNPENWAWRSDYNQLCIDLGGLNYRSNLNGIKTHLAAYMNDAFTADETIDDYFAGENIIGEKIMLVNGNKTGIWEGGTVLTAWPGKLCVDFSQNITEYNNLTVGTVFSDFDFDDETIMFQNMNDLSGPANTGAYSSLNVGVNNRVIRRASFAAGKELNSEHDFAFLLGRKGRNHHYCSFLWAPGFGSKGDPSSWANTTHDYCFHIGLKATFANLHKDSDKTNRDKFDIKVIDSSNNWKNLYEHVWNCLTADSTLSTYIHQKFNEFAGEGFSSGYTVTIKPGSETTSQGHVTVNGFEFGARPSNVIIDGQDSGTNSITIDNQTYIKCPSSSGVSYNPATAVTTIGGSIVKLNSDVTISLDWNCFAAGTLIMLADGTTKKIEDITFDDDLLVWNFDEGKLDSAKPIWIKKKETANFYWNIQLESGKSIKTCGQYGHRFFDLGTNTWIYGSDVAGKTIYTIDGPEKVISSEKTESVVDFYNIITEKHINLFANRLLAGCSLENHLYPVKDMKFIKDNRELRGYDEFAADVPEWWFNGCRYAESIADKEYLVKYCKDRLPLQV